MNRENIDMCKIVMEYKVLTHKDSDTEFYDTDTFRNTYGSDEFSAETNVAAATELAQAGDLDVCYQSQCSVCGTVAIFSEVEPKKGTTLKNMLNNNCQCPFCHYEIQVDSSKKNPFTLYWRLSKKHVPAHNRTVVEVEDPPELVIKESLFKRGLKALGLSK